MQMPMWVLEMPGVPYRPSSHPPTVRTVYVMPSVLHMQARTGVCPLTTVGGPRRNPVPFPSTTHVGGGGGDWGMEASSSGSTHPPPPLHHHPRLVRPTLRYGDGSHPHARGCVCERDGVPLPRGGPTWVCDEPHMLHACTCGWGGSLLLGNPPSPRSVHPPRTRHLPLPH